MSFSVVVILPYFGALPNYFGVWLATAGRNPTIDWVLLTDQPVASPTANVRVVPTTLEALRLRFTEALGFPPALGSPYKLCDFKPAFGFLFPDVVAGYDFWAHADADVVWGDLRAFLTHDILERSDKVFAGGHLSLFRNSPHVNQAFRLRAAHRPLDYRTVFRSPQPFAFDEWGPDWNGMNAIIPDNGLRLYVEEMPYADIKVTRRALRTLRDDFGGPAERDSERRKHHILYRYDSGKIHQVALTPGAGLVSREEAYVHLQKRPMRIEVADLGSERFLVIPPNRFVDHPAGEIDELYLQHVCRERGPYWHYYATRARRVGKVVVEALSFGRGIRSTSAVHD